MCGAFVTALSTLAQNAVPLPAHAYYQLFLDFPCNYHLKWVTVGPISQFVTMTGFVIVRLERYSNTARYCNTFPLCWLQAALCLLSIFFYFPIVWIQILKKFLLLIFLNSLLKLFHVFSTVFFEHHCALRYFSSCPSLTTDSQRKLTDCASAGWTGRLLSVKVLGGGGGGFLIVVSSPNRNRHWNSDWSEFFFCSPSEDTMRRSIYIEESHWPRSFGALGGDHCTCF